MWAIFKYEWPHGYITADGLLTQNILEAQKFLHYDVAINSMEKRFRDSLSKYCLSEVLSEEIAASKTSDIGRKHENGFFETTFEINDRLRIADPLLNWKVAADLYTRFCHSIDRAAIFVRTREGAFILQLLGTARRLYADALDIYETKCVAQIKWVSDLKEVEAELNQKFSSELWNALYDKDFVLALPTLPVADLLTTRIHRRDGVPPWWSKKKNYTDARHLLQNRQTSFIDIDDWKFIPISQAHDFFLLADAKICEAKSRIPQ